MTIIIFLSFLLRSNFCNSLEFYSFNCGDQKADHQHITNGLELTRLEMTLLLQSTKTIVGSI
jgi:hypothetical protein